MSIEVFTPSCGGGSIGPWPGDIEGPLTFCTGSSGTYSVEKPQGARDLHWYLDGTLIQEDTTSSVTIAGATAGTYELCVDASNSCNDESGAPDPLCITIVIQDLMAINPPELTVCHDQTGEYDGIFYPPGVYSLTYVNPQGCDSTIFITVDPVFPSEEDLGPFYLCEGTSMMVHGQTFTSAQPGNYSILTQQAQPPNCDSTIYFSIGVLKVEAFVAPPAALGCNIQQVTLDGSGSVALGPTGSQIMYQWRASGGGVLGIPSDAPTMSVNTPGDYCLAIDIIAPDGSVTCSDTACVIVELSANLSPAPLISGPSAVCTTDTLTYTLQSQGQVPPTAYVWVLPVGVNTVQPNDSTLLLIATPGDTLTLCAYVTDECGDSPQACLPVTIGQADTVQINGQTCDPVQAGIFRDTLSNQAGCDSLVITTVTLRPSYSIPLTAYTCDSALAGVDTLHLQSEYGCDSIVVLTTIFTGQYQQSATQIICGSGVNYSDTLLITGGNCDSLSITDYQYVAPDTTMLSGTTCDASQAGIFTSVLQNQSGCDSTVITMVALFPPDVVLVESTTCDPTQAVYEVITLSNQYGCDSVVTRSTEWVGIDTTFLARTSCDSAQVGVFVNVWPMAGAPCDSVVVETVTWAAQSVTVLPEITRCEATGPAADTTSLVAASGCDSLVVRPYSYTQLAGIPEALPEGCAGASDGQLALTATNGSAPPWEYRLDAGPWQSAPVFSGLAPGSYTLIVRDANGCTRSWEGLLILPGETLTLDAGPDREVDPGALVTLAVTSPLALAQVQWSAIDPLQCATCAATTLGPVTVSQWVTVQGWTAAGCSGTDQVEIRIKELEYAGVYIPNSFSPNGDGINDVFRIFDNDQLRMIRQFAVYDRWGNALLLQQDLQPDDPSAGWDGTFRAQAMDPGVYVYAIELELADGRIRRYKGDVQLLR